MKINGESIPRLGVFDSLVTVPDCVVTTKNKIGRGHGEAKLYLGSKDSVHDFFGNPGFEANCFMLKSDLLAYMSAMKNEYHTPSQDYRGKDEMGSLWEMRYLAVQSLDDVVSFTMNDQDQITGPRGYVNSDDDGYQIIRNLALPLVSYIYIEKVGDESQPSFYWKLYADFNAIWEKQETPLVLKYGNRGEDQRAETAASKKQAEKKAAISQARNGQGKYRKELLEQCPYCPITMISDERLLIASHIKPWAACNDDEKVDPYNGYTLSPMFDKLFDQGFITFTRDRRLICSDFLSKGTWKRIGLKNNVFVQPLPMDDKRIKYLDFHHQSVFKGSFSD